jgi:hypothetical protein
MANLLSFNRHRPPILPVELLDDEHTVINILPPTVDLQEELRAKLPDLNALLVGNDEEKRVALFDLAARLMSCNRNMRKISPEELRKVYRIDEEDLVVFFNAYADFLTNLEHTKN